ncbi:hypothetical protein GWI33_005449 [Rhynchophorus ferrugineus]|uniref:Uncharacterized protein n=1 Tax=Rhynchophorus ferrugineus TaxID=354439 RepID=A0A834IJA5_RHYFE|nr:hypothetical protein GWI33_005449 [Rhynchophorus ferrugineus]
MERERGEKRNKRPKTLSGHATSIHIYKTFYSPVAWSPPAPGIPRTVLSVPINPGYGLPNSALYWRKIETNDLSGFTTRPLRDCSMDEHCFHTYFPPNSLPIDHTVASLQIGPFFQLGVGKTVGYYDHLPVTASIS